MLKYFVYRFVSLLPKLFIITVVIFIGIQLVPGDPITRSISPELYAKLSQVQLAALREKLGLNDNLVIQYFRWIGNLFQGNMGYSLVNGSSIGDMIVQRLPATFELAVVGLTISTILGLIMGFVSAIRQNKFIDYVNSVLGMIGISVPEFFFGILAIMIFALSLDWLPTGGRMVAGKEAFFSRLEFLVMPALCLGISYIATLMRFTRSSMLDVLNKDYIKTSRSKGVSELNVNIAHGFRNALIPIMVILVFRIPALVGGTIIIECIFNYPGMGNLMMNAISGADMPVVMMCALIFAIAILLSSFLLDIITAMLDPRVKFGKQ